VPIPSAHYEFGDEDSIVSAAISEMQSAVYPLVVVTPTQVQCIGTAFCIAGAGVLATARHVVDDADRLITEARAQGDHRIGLAVMWYGSAPGGSSDVLGIRVPISDLCRHPDERFDFALLTAMVPKFDDERIRFPSLPLDFAMPAVDDLVIMLGYTGFTFEESGDTTTIQHPMRLSRGHVKDVHFPIRDVTRAPFPASAPTPDATPA
jgi:hypothetical protein